MLPNLGMSRGLNRTASRQVTIPPGVLCQKVGDEAVLLNLDTGRYFGANAIGTSIWNHLTKTRSVEATYTCMLEEFDIDPERLKADLEHFASELERRGLIRIHGGPPL